MSKKRKARLSIFNKKQSLKATAEQLASLDLLIAKKQAKAIRLDDAVTNIVGKLVAQTAMLNDAFGGIAEIEGAGWTDDLQNVLGNVAANATIAAVAAGAVTATPGAAVTAVVGAAAAVTDVAVQMAEDVAVELAQLGGGFQRITETPEIRKYLETVVKNMPLEKLIETRNRLLQRKGKPRK